MIANGLSSDDLSSNKQANRLSFSGREGCVIHGPLWTGAALDCAYSGESPL